jgi:hypothetical protein
MASRLAASMAVLTAGVCLSACGSSSKTTVTQTVTTTVASGDLPPGTHAAGSGQKKSGGAGGGASTTSQPSPQGGSSAGSDGSTGGSGGSGGSASGGSGGSGGSTGSGSTRGVTPLARHVVDNTERVHITGRQGGLIIQQGVVTGAPIDNGTVVMRNRLTGGGVITAFTVKGSAGSVRGLGNAVLEVQGSNVHYRGTARIVGGTGRFSRVRSAHLTVTGNGSLSGDTTLHVTGIEWY